MMTLAARVDAFKQANRNNQASWPWMASEKGLPVIYGVKVIGNTYRRTGNIHGSYPPGVLRYVMDLFPDVCAAAANHAGPMHRRPMLHAFSGSLPQSDRYLRVDSRKEPAQGCNPDLVENVLTLPDRMILDGYGDHLFDLIMADPPYSPKDAEVYGVPMVDRRRAVHALAQVTKPGGYIAWLDTQWPMHRSEVVRTAGRLFLSPRPDGDDLDVDGVVRTAGEVMVQGSTNHDLRAIYLFERKAA